MSAPLTPADFPLRAVGPNVYRRSESSPLFVATDDAIAADLAARINRDQASSFQHGPGIPVYRHPDATDDVLGK